MPLTGKEPTPHLFAWVGEDEMGSGVVGLKQAHTPAGLIALVATGEEKASQEYIVDQMQRQATRYGKTIRLVRYVPADDVITLNP